MWLYILVRNVCFWVVLIGFVCFFLNCVIFLVIFFLNLYFYGFYLFWGLLFKFCFFFCNLLSCIFVKEYGYLVVLFSFLENFVSYFIFDGISLNLNLICWFFIEKVWFVIVVIFDLSCFLYFIMVGWFFL